MALLNRSTSTPFRRHREADASRSPTKNTGASTWVILVLGIWILVLRPLLGGCHFRGFRLRCGNQLDGKVRRHGAIGLPHPQLSLRGASQAERLQRDLHAIVLTLDNE